MASKEQWKEYLVGSGFNEDAAERRASFLSGQPLPTQSPPEAVPEEADAYLQESMDVLEESEPPEIKAPEEFEVPEVPEDFEAADLTEGMELPKYDETIGMGLGPLIGEEKPETRLATPYNVMAQDEALAATENLRQSAVDHFMRMGSTESAANSRADELVSKYSQWPLERAQEDLKKLEPGLAAPVQVFLRATGRQIIPLEIEQGETAKSTRKKMTAEKEREFRDLGLFESIKATWAGMGEEISETDAEAAGLSKPWVDKLLESYGTGLWTGATAPLQVVVGTPIDTLSQAVFGYDIPAATSAQEIYETIGTGIEGYQEGAEAGELQKLVSPDLAKRAAAKAVTSDVGLWAAKTAGIMSPEEAAKNKALLHPSENMVGLADAVRKAKESGENDEMVEATIEGTLVGMSPADLPFLVGAKAPKVEDFKRAAEADPSIMDNPGLSRIITAIDEGQEDKANDLLRRLTYREMPAQLRQEFAPDIDKVSSTVDDINEMWKKTGGEAAETAMQVVGSVLMKKTDEGVFVESTAGKAMRMAGVLQTAILEADVNPVGIGVSAWRALAPEAAEDFFAPVTNALEDVRLPTAAGVDFMLASDDLGPLLHEQLGIQNYDRIRDPSSTWFSRTMAKTATGDMGVVVELPDILTASGVEEDSSWMSAAKTMGLAADFLVPWEGYALKPVTAPLERGYAGLKAARSMTAAGPRMKFASATAFPEIYAWRKGLKDTDIPTVHGHFVGSMVRHQIYEGKFSPEVLPRDVRAVINDVVRVVADPSEAKKGRTAVEDFYAKLSEQTAANRQIFLGNMEDLLENGTEDMKALRTSPGYVRFESEIDGLIGAGNIEPQYKGLVLGMFEVQAYRAAADAKIRGIDTPADFFEAVSFTRGREPGEFSLFQEGTSPGGVGMERQRAIPAAQAEDEAVIAAREAEIARREQASIEARERALAKAEEVAGVRGQLLYSRIVRQREPSAPTGFKYVPDTPDIRSAEFDDFARNNLIYTDDAGNLRAASADMALPDGSMSPEALDQVQEFVLGSGLAVEVRPDGGFRFPHPPGMSPSEYLAHMRVMVSEINGFLGDLDVAPEALLYAERTGVAPEKVKRSAAFRWYREITATPKETPYGRRTQADTGRRGASAQVPEGTQRAPELFRYGGGATVGGEREFPGLDLEPTEVGRRGLGDDTAGEPTATRGSDPGGAGAASAEETFGDFTGVGGSEFTQEQFIDPEISGPAVKPVGRADLAEVGPEDVTVRADDLIVEEIEPSVEQLRGPAPVFFSKLRQETDKLLEGSKGMKASSLLAKLEKSVKGEELEWTGFGKWLADKKQEQVTPGEVKQFLDENEVRLEEVVKREIPVEANEIQAILNEEEELRQALVAAHAANHTPMVIDALQEQRGVFTSLKDAFREWRDATHSSPVEDMKPFLIPENVAEDIKQAVWWQDGDLLDAADEPLDVPSKQNPEGVVELLQEEFDIKSRMEILAFKRNRLQGTPFKPREDEARWSDFVHSGGENYREILIKLPDDGIRKQYKSVHWVEPDVLAHVRMDERVGSDGEKILFVQEIQSDWHQAGRKRRYQRGDKANVFTSDEMVVQQLGERDTWKVSPRGDKNNDVRFGRLDDGRYEWIDPYTDESFAGTFEEVSQRVKQWLADDLNSRRLPDAPFKETWYQLATKRILRMAAEEGFDKVQFNTGDAIHSVVGGKIEGQRAFYDKILPNFLQKYTKQFGTKPYREKVPDAAVAIDRAREGDPGVGDFPILATTIDVTPEMAREVVEKGQPLFQRGARGEPRGFFEQVEPIDAKGVRFVINMFSSGDLGTLFHENGHLLRWMMGSEHARQFAKYFDHDIMPDGSIKFTRAGEEQAADAFMWYARTKVAPGGRMQRLMDEAYVNIQQVWARARGRTAVLPPGMREFWDQYFAPHQVVKSEAVLKTYESQKFFPKVKVSRSKAERIEAEAPRKAGQRAEALRIDLRTEDVADALGITDDVLEMDPVELYSRAAAYAAAEQARKNYGGQLVRLTSRTVVPLTRQERVVKDVNKRLGLAGIDPKKLKITKETPQGPVRFGEEMKPVDIVNLSDAQAAQFGALVDELNSEPLGNGLPAAVTNKLIQDDADWSKIALEDFNQTIDVLVDVNSGIGSRRSRMGESVSPTAMHAAVTSVVNFGDKIDSTLGMDLVGRIRRDLKNRFVMPEYAKGAADPGAVEIFQSSARKMSGVTDWMVSMARKSRKQSPAETMGEITDGIRRMLTPPVHVGGMDELIRLNELFNVTVSGKRTGLTEKAGTRPAGIDLKGWTEAEMSKLRWALQYGHRITDDEHAALAFLDDFISSKANQKWKTSRTMDISDEQADALGKAVQEIGIGLKKRHQAFIQRTDQLIEAWSGSDAGQAGKLKAGIGHDIGLRKEIYRRFYNPEPDKKWEDVLDWMVSVGLRTKEDFFDKDLAAMQAIARMRALDIMMGMSEDMARHGLMVDVKKFSKKYGVDVKDPDGFLNQVVRYLNNEASFLNSNVVVDAPEGSAKKTEVLRGVPGVVQRVDVETGDVFNVQSMDAYLIADKLMAQYGWKKGAGNWERVVLPDGSEVLLPGMVNEELQQTLKRVGLLGRAFGKRTPSTTIGRVLTEMLEKSPLTYTRIKMGITTGLLLPNPAYYMANLMGGAFQLYQGAGAMAAMKATAGLPIEAARLGATSAARAMGISLGEPGTTGAVVAGLWGRGTYKPQGKALVTKTGKIYTTDMLVDMARQEGLKSSYIHAETAQHFAREIRDLEPTYWNKMMTAPRWWQDQLTEGATAIDNYYRVGVFVDAIKRGDSPAAAAEIARAIGYDYSALTEFERTHARKTFMFYSYMRKNMDLTWHTLMHNPERVLGQFRLMHGVHNAYLEEEPEIVLRDWQKMRLGVGFRSAAAAAHGEKLTSHPNSHVVSQTMWLAPPLPIQDSIGFWMDASDILGSALESAMGGRRDFDEEAWRQLLSRLNPYYRVPIELAFNKDLFMGKDFDAHNRVPPWMVEIDRHMTGGMLVDDVLGVQARENYDLSRAEAPGARWYHASNGRSWFALRNLLQIPGFGRSIDTVDFMDRANLGIVEAVTMATREIDPAQYWNPRSSMRRPIEEEGFGPDIQTPRVGMSALDEFWGLLGFKPYAIPTGEAAVAKIQEDRARAMKEAEANLSKGEYYRYMGEQPLP